MVESFGGGVFEMVRLLAEGLAHGGDRVGVAYGLRPETPADVRAQVDTAVELFPLPWVRRPRAQVRAGRSLRRLYRQWKPDVVHLHSSFAGVVGLLALDTGPAVIYTPHGYSFTMGDQSAARRAVYRLVERQVARGAVIGAVSETEGARAREDLGAARVQVVCNGIPELDPGALPFPSEPDRPRVIAMGRVDAARRPEASARILSSLTDLAEVRWVGGGGRRTGAEHDLARLGIEVTGWLGRAAALEQLGRSTAYLHWAAWDGQPLTVLEAMARDVVVVASDIPPLRELLGPQGVRGTEQEAVALLREILTDPARREAMLAAQRQRRGHYGSARMVSQWRTLYGRLVPAAPAAG